MPTTAPGTALPRSPLEQVGTDFAEESESFIALEALPPFAVRERASERLVFTAQKAMGEVDTGRGRDGKINRVTRDQLKKQVYSCAAQMLEYPIDAVEEAELQTVFDIDSAVEGAQTLVRLLERAHEIRVASLLFNTSTTFANNNAVGPKVINDPTNADVESMAITAREEIHAQGGGVPNTIVMGYETFLRHSVCAQVRERVIYQTPEGDFAREAAGATQLSAAQLARFYQVDRVLVGNALVDANAPDASTDGSGGASLGAIWSSDYILFANISQGMDLRNRAQLGRTFYWDQFTAPGGRPWVNPPYPEGPLNMILPAWRFLDAQVFNEACGFLFTGINAAA